VLLKRRARKGRLERSAQKIWFLLGSLSFVLVTPQAHLMLTLMEFRMSSKTWLSRTSQGLSDEDEIFFFGTDPNNPDTDYNGLEVQQGTDPLFPN